MLSSFVKRASEGIHLKTIAENERGKEGEERQGESNSNLRYKRFGIFNR